jgi:hypothetical protein
VYSIGTGLGSTGKGVADGLILVGKSAVGAGGKTNQEEVMKLDPEDAATLQLALKQKAERSKEVEAAPEALNNKAEGSKEGEEVPEKEPEQAPEGEETPAESPRRPRKIEMRSGQKENV